MKHLLKEGEISELSSDEGFRGWSGEVHLVKHDGKKYVLRKVSSLKKARFYKKISRMFEKEGFLPEFIGRRGKNVFYEYIEGRDLAKKEPLKVIKQLGAISAQVNKIKTKKNGFDFNEKLEQAASGKFPNKIVKPVITRRQKEKIKRIYEHLKEKCEPVIAWDVSDVNPDNFRIRKGKVYLVDVESIRPRIRGFGIGKAFFKWFKKSEQRKAFMEGYNSVSSSKSFDKDYLDFIYLNFLVNEINHMAFYGKDYRPRKKIRLEKLKELLDKY